MKMIRVTSTLLLWGSAVAFGCSSGDSGGSSTPGQTVCGEAATTGIATADACIQENCCASFAPCHQDAACRACIAGSGSGCDGNTLFQAFSACVAANDCFGSGGTGGKGGAGGGASGSGGATACAEHKDCKGQLCVAGTCKPCATTSECVSAYSAIYECKDGKCQSTACTVDEDCASKGMLCRNHVCSACETNSDCTSSSAYPGYQCLLGRCSDGDCTASADCPSDAPICGGKSECRGCQTDAECLEKKGTASGYVCDTQSGLCPEGDCSPNGKGCGASKDQICEDYHCRECTDDTDCQTVFGAGFLCMTGHCIAAECQNDLDCSGGQRICDTATHKCRDCLTNSQECGTGKVCGSDGKCHTGNCYPPGVACCDLDGNIRLDSYKCYQASVKTEYRCDSTACGAAAQELKYYRYCDGVTSECGDNNVQPSGDWETISDCPADWICESGATFAQCTYCPNGCSNGACYGDCTPGTPCCTELGEYAPSDVPCSTNPVGPAEFRCGSTACGGELQMRFNYPYCSGFSEDCGQTNLKPGPWLFAENCGLSNGYCRDSVTGAKCEPCPAPGCKDGKCFGVCNPADPCCDDQGQFEPETTPCNQNTGIFRTVCDNTGCGGTFRKERKDLYCQGGTLACNREVWVDTGEKTPCNNGFCTDSPSGASCVTCSALGCINGYCKQCAMGPYESCCENYKYKPKDTPCASNYLCLNNDHMCGGSAIRQTFRCTGLSATCGSSNMLETQLSCGNGYCGGPNGCVTCSPKQCTNAPPCTDDSQCVDNFCDSNKCTYSARCM